MKVTVERLPESRVQLDIVSDEQEFDQAVDRAYRRMVKDIAIPGFRPGKAPRAMVEQRYGRDMFVEEAQRELMDRLYREAIRQENLQPIGDPSATITEMEPLAFQVVFPVYPEVDLKDYASVRVDPIDASISDEDRDATIETLRRNASEWTDIKRKRKPRDGDQVTVDIEVTENGENFQEPVEGAQFVLGESNIFEGLRKELESMNIGDTAEFDLTFAEDDETVSPALRGKTLHYKVTLTAIRVQELVPLDDEFAKTTANVDTVDELKREVRDSLHREKTNNARTTVVNDALNRIAEQAELDLPAVMIDEAVDDEIKQMRLRLSQSGETLESYLRAAGQTEAELRVEIRDDAARRLRNTLVLQTIAQREQVEVTDQDILDEIEKVASGAPNGDAIRNLYQQEQFRNMLRGDLFERRLTDRLLDIVTEGKGPVVNGWVAPTATDDADTSDASNADAAAEANNDEPNATAATRGAEAKTADAGEAPSSNPETSSGEGEASSTESEVASAGSEASSSERGESSDAAGLSAE